MTERAYSTVVIGTDGSESSLRAGSLAGAKDLQTFAIMGSPVEALLDVVGKENADLLVVGNRGLAGIEGRLLDSVAADATRRSARDVLVVHTTG